MSELSLSGAELLQWCDETAEHWFVLMEEHPAILALPCDIMNVQSVARLMQHIVAVPLRYAQQLEGSEPDSYDRIPCGNVAELRTTHMRARTMYEQMLQRGVAWEEIVDVVTRSAGTFHMSRKKIFFHANLHTIRHFAQLATLVRQHGYKPGWEMDFLMTQAVR